MTAAIVLIPLALMALVIVNPLRSGESVSTVPSIATSSTRPKAPATTAPTPGTGTPSPLAEQTTTGTPTATPTGTPTSVTPEPEQTSTPSVTPSAPIVPVTAPPPTSTVAPKKTPTPNASTVVYKNCDEVRAAGKAPLHRGDPGYTPELDHNGDGVACGDRGNS